LGKLSKKSVKRKKIIVGSQDPSDNKVCNIYRYFWKK